MKTATFAFACLLWSMPVCWAEPPTSPEPPPTGLRDLAPSEIDQLTLDVDSTAHQSISFRAFGTRFVLSSQLIYVSESVSQATELIAQFRAAKYISITAEANGHIGSDGALEASVRRIQFHY